MSALQETQWARGPLQTRPVGEQSRSEEQGRGRSTQTLSLHRCAFGQSLSPTQSTQNPSRAEHT